MNRCRRYGALLWWCVLVVGCGQVGDGDGAGQERVGASVAAIDTPVVAPVTATALATKEVPATYTAIPLVTATATATLTPTPTATPTETPTPTVTPTPTITPTPSATPINRTCPNPAPLKPAYSRSARGDSWPRPDISQTETHFWLGHPFAGGSRLLVNNNFPYGWDMSGRLLLHNGIDMAQPLGTPVLAVGDGRVVVAQGDQDELYGWRCNWYGHLVVIELDQQWQGQSIYALYGHVLELKVVEGERVVRGQELAEVGYGGAATHPHLHFEVRVGTNEFSSTRNPVLWISPGPTRGVIVGRLVDGGGRPWQGVGISIVGGPRGELVNSWSYLGDPQNLMNPDEGWAENFVFGDVRPGTYRLATKVNGRTYSQEIEVVGGEITVVEIVTE
ncbi:MAG TPA: M23 family metallopeptidase [Anaerolineae bacterium]|nr:M23 family metallopeptidase [Anaerolineae bacterium]